MPRILTSCRQIDRHARVRAPDRGAPKRVCLKYVILVHRGAWSYKVGVLTEALTMFEWIGTGGTSFTVFKHISRSSTGMIATSSWHCQWHCSHGPREMTEHWHWQSRFWHFLLNLNFKSTVHLARLRVTRTSHNSTVRDFSLHAFLT
jgi:hypothetical protein